MISSYLSFFLSFFIADFELSIFNFHNYTVRLWDAGKGTFLSKQLYVDGDVEQVTSVAISADGQTVVSSSQDGMVRLWKERIPLISFCIRLDWDWGRGARVGISGDGGRWCLVIVRLYNFRT